MRKQQLFTCLFSLQAPITVTVVLSPSWFNSPVEGSTFTRFLWQCFEGLPGNLLRPILILFFAYILYKIQHFVVTHHAFVKEQQNRISVTVESALPTFDICHATFKSIHLCPLEDTLSTDILRNQVLCLNLDGLNACRALFCNYKT